MQVLQYFFTTLPWKMISTSKVKFIVMSLPLILLATVLTLLNVAQTSYAHIIDQRILPAIEDRERVFSMKKENSMDADDFVPYYTAEDLEVIRKIGTIENVAPVTSSLLGEGSTESLVDGEQIVFTDISATSNEAMKLIGTDGFTFVEGQPIPVVIGIEALKQYKDILQVNDTTSSEKKVELLTDYQNTTSFTTTFSDRGLIKELVGKQFTFSLGELEKTLVLYSMAMPTEMPYSFIPDSTRVELQQQIEELIGQFWDYDALAKGIEVEAQVVGIDYSLNPSTVSLPFEAAEYLHAQLLEHQQSAQLDGVKLDSLLVGSRFQGVFSSSDGIQSGHTGSSSFIIPEEVGEINRAFIPGLYYQFTHDSTGATLLSVPLDIGKVTTAKINIIMSDATQLQNTLNALISQGMVGGVSATNSYSGISSFTDTLDSISFYISTIFTLICVIIALFLMLRTAKNSQFESGVLRVIGATRESIMLNSAGLLLWQLIASLIIGVAIGYAIALAASPFVADYMQDSSILALDIINSRYGIEVGISNFDVQRLNIFPLLASLGWVIAICLIGVLISGLLTSRVSPIEIVSKNR